MRGTARLRSTAAGLQISAAPFFALRLCADAVGCVCVVLHCFFVPYKCDITELSQSKVTRCDALFVTVVERVITHSHWDHELGLMAVVSIGMRRQPLRGGRAGRTARRRCLRGLVPRHAPARRPRAHGPRQGPDEGHGRRVARRAPRLHRVPRSSSSATGSTTCRCSSTRVDRSRWARRPRR